MKPTHVILEVNQVSKAYCRSIRRGIINGVYDVAGEFAFWKERGKGDLRRGEFWALQDVSFQLGPGESLGIVGPNGAGKSTLLKLIAGIVKPDQGDVRVRGQVGALFVSGPGFHPLLTGRQNVFVAGGILGFTTREIRENEGAIYHFASLGDAIDAPVFTYSSGMVARLGFAIASHLKPALLLIDEVLAVGDATFQFRCMERIHELRDGGTSIILVSHNPYQISRLCDKALVLQNGKMIREILADEAVAEHFRIVNDCRGHSANHAKGESVFAEADQRRGGKIKLVELRSLDGRDSVERIESGSSFRVRLHYQFFSQLEEPVFRVNFSDESGVLIAQTSSYQWLDSRSLVKSGWVDLVVSDFQLMPGNYLVGVLLNSELGRLHEISQALEFTVWSADSALLIRTANHGIIALKSDWQIGD